MKGIFLAVLVGLLMMACSTPPEPGEAYIVENIEMPKGLTSQVGALEFLPNGKLIAGFTRGEVMTYDTATKEWHLFAEGLHDPLGIHVVSNDEILVMQLPELTRLKDTDGDGTADLYEKVTDAFGITGNYHEFNYGPEIDSKGDFYIALNSSSPGGTMRDEVRGTINLEGRDGETGNRQMFSTVPYRGWVMKLTKDGVLHPVAAGFRSPNGVVVDDDDNVFVTDNQGDWVGTSPLFHVESGKFYGHPGGLVWRKGWNRGNPFHLPLDTLDSMRTRPAICFPHGIMANSPSQPVFDHTEGKFGPFEGQLFIGEMNRERIIRVMLEKVNGKFQGACIPFLDSLGLRKGNNRLAFAPDGSLWVGQNAHGWLGDMGIQRIVFTGKLPVDVYTMKLTTDGFQLTFTQPMQDTAALNPENYLFSRYYYLYHHNYGSPQQNLEKIPVTAVKLSDDKKTVTLQLASLKPGYVYELNLGDIPSKWGQPLRNRLVCYTLNELLNK